jgi:hypothetical protein
MKTTSILKAAALSLALAPVTQADVTFNITGSTAFRSVTMQAIVNTLTDATSCWEGSALGSSDRASFRGTVTGIDGIVTVNTRWSGSVEGMTAVAAGVPIGDWLNPAPGDFQSTTNGTFGNQKTVGFFPRQSLTPTVACSDVGQGATAVTADLEDTIGGIIPFRFLASESAPATFTNITDQQHEALWSAGTLPLWVFTGDAADTRICYAIGRDAGSGTRVTRLAETRYGITTPVTQFRVTTTGSGLTLASTLFRTFPNQIEEPGTISGQFKHPTLSGNGGYTSNSTLATILASTTTSVVIQNSAGVNRFGGVPQSIVAVGHVGLNDGNNAVNGGAKSLTYNGVGYSIDNVRTGKYTAWGYLHVFNQNGVLSDDEIAARDAIVGAFATSMFPFGATLEAGIADDENMLVVRGEDGGLVGPK